MFLEFEIMYIYFSEGIIQLNFFITYVEIYGDFTDIYIIVTASTEMELQIVNQTPVLSDYKSLLVTPGHILLCILWLEQRSILSFEDLVLSMNKVWSQV